MIAVPSPLLGKMDDKKRPAAAGDDAQAPPRKKLVTDASGKSKVDRDADMPWKDDLEVCWTARGIA